MNPKKICIPRIITSMARKVSLLTFLAVALLLSPMVVYGAAVDLAWDANTEPELAGYKIYYGTASGDYSHSIDVGNTTQYTLTDLEDGVTYYLAATAYDVDNNETDYSEELVHTFSAAKPTVGNLDYCRDFGPCTAGEGDCDNDSECEAGLSCVQVEGVDICQTISPVCPHPVGHLDYCRDCGPCAAGQGDCDNDGECQSGLTCVQIEGVDTCQTSSPDLNGNPTTPSVPVGPSTGHMQTGYNFSTAASDPDGNALQYRFDWGNGVISTWGSASQTYSWSLPGTFCVKAQAKDDSDAVSEWSTCQYINISAQSYTITATTDSNGSILPLGIVDVTHGSSQTFNLSAAVNYHVQEVLVDGVSVGARSSYTFTNVTQNHTIRVIFAGDIHPPVADAGADQAVYVNNMVRLDGSHSSDADGDSLIFHWSIVSKPSGSSAMLSNSQAVKPTFDVDVAGTYTVQLIVNDGTVNSAPDTVTISTENSAPVSDAGADQSILVHDTVQLDGSASSDIDGNILTFNWSIVSKPSGSNATLSDTKDVKPVFVVDVTGNYTVRLIVNDGTANSAPDMVTISTQNSAPVGDAGADQTVLVHDTVQLDGSGSSDVDGDSLTFDWSLVSKPGGSSAVLSDTKAVKPVFDVDLAGNYTVQLIVNDGKRNSAPDTVTISTENSTPLSDAGVDQSVRINDPVQLDGSGSSDVDGNTLTFKWSIVSKPGDSSAILSDTKAVKPVFDVDVAGSYTVQLIVNDGVANSAPDTVTISTENSAPVANAGADQAVLVNDSVQLDGSGSSDVDGNTLTFKWSIVSKPGGSKATLSDTTVGKPTVDVDIAGTYTLQLIVNDGTVNSAPDTVTLSTENSAPVSHAGADQSMRVNDTAQLDGSASRDADGDTLTFKWSFISKPDGSIAAISNATAVNPTFTVDVAGSYTVQLIANDGTDNSTPDTVTLSTENSPPVSNAGNDQTVEEGETVTLSGLKSTDPDGNIASYTWQQTGGKSVTLSNLNGAEATFTAPNAVTEADTLTFRLTVQDTEGLQDIDYCNTTVFRAAAVDADSDGVPDGQDAFPNDPDEYLDTDGDGEGDHADTDDDNDSMPDAWELAYGMDPLKDDADDDPDGDGVSNLNEYNLGTEPNYHEGNFEPYPPSLKTPDDHAIVALTPLLATDEFYDPNINDVHRRTQWKIIRAEDGFIVFDVTTDSSLISMTVPKMILEYDTNYIWQVKFIDNHGAYSDWSEAGYFTTEFLEEDSDGNGVLDHQEVDDTLDLDKNGILDREQSDIKCIVADSGKAQIGVSIEDAENVDSILSLEIEDIDDISLIPKSKGRPGFIEFGLLHFKLLLNAPGEETVVTIHLSRAAFDEGRIYKSGKRYNSAKRYNSGKRYRKVKMYKYDPVNTEWLDYSEYAEFSSDRKKVYLTLKDGGFGDADGVENGIIVDPLAFGSETNPNSGSDSFIEDVADNLIPGVGCFISAIATSRPADRLPSGLWREVRDCGLSALFILMMLAYFGKVIFLKFGRVKRDGQRESADSRVRWGET